MTRMERITSAVAESGVRGLLSSACLLAGAEMANRVTRIFTAIALAWAFSIEEFGIAAAALTVHELTRMLIQNGLGTRIVAVGENELQATATAVYRMNWLLGVALFLVQLAIAIPIGAHFGSSSLAMTIAALGIVHIVYPWSMVQVYLAQRAGRWRLVGTTLAVTACADNVLTALLALSGLGLAAIVIPKIVASVVWIAWHLKSTHWVPGASPRREQYRGLLHFAVRILFVEMLATLRQHGDKAVVGFLLGPAALGIYAFAANIGRSIVGSLSAALTAVILPRLREARDDGHLARTHAMTMAVMVLASLPFVAILAGLSDRLIPAVFGDKWRSASALVGLMAVMAIGHPLLLAVSQMLRATDRASADAVIGLLATAAFFTGLVVGLPFGVERAALLSGLGQLLVAVIAAICSFAMLRSSKRADAIVGAPA